MNNRERVKPSGFFYGWWLVLVAGVGLFMGYVPIIGFTFSVFFKSLAQEFKWSRGEISLAFSISLLALSIALPIAGRLVDRLGARRIIIPAVLFFGLGLSSFYFLTSNLWYFYAVYLFLGVVGSGISPVPYYHVISRWFDRRRGLALGLSMTGAGLSAFIMPSLSYFLISKIGWRLAYVAIASGVVIVTLLVVAPFLKETPEEVGLKPDGEDASEGGPTPHKPSFGLSTGEALRSGTFWVMSSSFFLVSLSLSGCLIHMVPLLTDRNLSAQKAALAVSVLGGANLLGRLVTGYLLDHFKASYIALYLFSGSALGILFLWMGMAGNWAFLAALLIGLGMGAEGDIMAYLIGRYYGLRAYGEIYGYVLSIYTVGAMIGPIVMGAAFDRTGSYSLILFIFFVATLLGSSLITRLGPYRKWEPSAQPAA
jgi:MFS family permease